MRRGPIFAMMMLPLAGCVPVPGGPGYGGYAPAPYQGGYEQPGYPPPAYGYQDSGYPGYSYNEGSPYIVEEGVTLPLIFFGGAWGYYDRDRHFRRAPEHVYRDLQARHPGGSGARVFSGQAIPPRFNGGGQAAPHFNGGGQAPPPHFNGGQPAWQGGGQAVQHPPPSFAAPPQHAAPVAAPVQHAPPPAQQPRREEPRGHQQCPPGQFRC
jgi:hypothetical protein